MTENDVAFAIIRVYTTIAKFHCKFKTDSLNILIIKYKIYKYGF